MSLPPPLDRAAVAAQVAADIEPGWYVNLGIGWPTLVADAIAGDPAIVLHTENGMLGMGPLAPDAEPDPELMNAGKQPVAELPGASYFHHADSFAMIRGRHLDVAVLGAFQVSMTGDLANWHTGEPGAIPAVGGAMDLALGAARVWVMMSLLDRNGLPKLVRECTYPLTAVSCVDRVYTDYGVFAPGESGLSVLRTYSMPSDELIDLLGLRSRSDEPLHPPG